MVAPSGFPTQSAAVSVPYTDGAHSKLSRAVLSVQLDTKDQGKRTFSTGPY